MSSTSEPPLQLTVRVDAQGRVVLPAAVRERFHWSPGATLHLQADETGVRLQDRAAILAEIRALGAPLRAQGYTLERLVAELAEEAEEE